MAAAGAVAGLLLLVHAHSFVAVMVVGAGVALLTGLKEWRVWAIFFAAAIAVAAPQMWWATHGSSVRASDFFGWHTGWDHGEENVLRFWFKNTGLFIPLLVAALLWRERVRGETVPLVPRPLLLFYLPFTLCFVVPNLIKLAPWVWDNIKVIYYWFLASVPLVAHTEEYPSPLSSCEGYRAPTGLPLIIQLGTGARVPHVLGSYIGNSLGPLDHCVFDEGTYRNDDREEERLGRSILAARDAVVLIPRAPLRRGESYRVVVEVAGLQRIDWQFTVAR